MLHGDNSIDELDIPSAFHVDELEPDEPDTFATQAVREPVALSASSTSFRDFAAANASPSLTSQLAGEGIGRTHVDLPVQRRSLYDMVDSLSERGSSPVVAAASPAGRLTEQN
ncbi:hypothetical protein PHYSODRAFT_527930 [Phytophthora sojae]|uniref:Uncharacterized protein n=1 Tax=Phytophthora sojae (strain P6497) TaxID=1094619 RepID=G5A9L7_PHYSP|nr:hypothetical protein PHYSODRAFT_527930 [Phytophthora sojae]EGZ07297.1 hypothetical protein PHYSODRAFT_527930 [Phytophthora sojae]|eukprot:XP_009536863.1 hypothetical protein PHYSODRAFT_527930 [Phytophthora sojae]